MKTWAVETTGYTFDLEGLGRLREAQLSATPVNNERLSPGVYVSWDEDNTGPSVILGRDDGDMLAIQGCFEHRPKWFTLNLELGASPLGAGDRVALVVEGHVEGLEKGTAALPVYLRSTAGTQSDDIDAQGVLELGPEIAITIIFIQVDWPTEPESFHTLIVKLPKDGTRVVLRDFRVIHVLAERGPSVGRKTVSSFGV